MKNPDNVKRGKKSKAAGAAFELRVRKDLEEKGWIVDKFGNNVEFVGEHIKSEPVYELQGRMMNCRCGIDADFREGKLIQAKAKFRRPGIPIMMSAGFPDFACSQICSEGNGFHASIGKHWIDYDCAFCGVEVKTNGYLDKIERKKCRWYLDNCIFSKILIAEKTKVKNRVVIVYHDFEEKYGK